MTSILISVAVSMALLVAVVACAGTTAPATLATVATPSAPTTPSPPNSTRSVVPLTPTPSTEPATATSPPATTTPVPKSPTPAASAKLTVKQIAATAVAESIGEQCVATPPKPAKGFVGDPARGKVLYHQRGCVNCHGAQAQGDVGPKLAGTTLSFEAVIHQLREPRGVMQRYLPGDQSDADECDVLIYVKGLK